MISRSPRRRPPLGQHFLADPRLRRRILDLLMPKPEDCWLEIGAGHGEMTLELAPLCRALVGVERDRKLAAQLRERLAPLPGARVLEADILKVSLAALARELGCEKLHVYGSLPYYITSPILRLLFDSLAVLADIHVVIQQEVAERLVASPGGRDYGYLSALAQFHTTPEMLLTLPRGAFRPSPQVDSALVRLAPPGQGEALGVSAPEDFLRFVSACFRQKRKTLRNNLRALVPPAQMEDALTLAGLAPRARAEELSLEEFARLFHILGRAGGVFVARRSL